MTIQIKKLDRVAVSCRWVLTGTLSAMLLAGCGSSDEEAKTNEQDVAVEKAAPEIIRPDFSGVWQVVEPVLQLKTADNEMPPLLADAKAQYETRLASFEAGNFADYDPVFQGCKPMGSPRNFYDGSQPENILPFEIQQRDDGMMFGYTFNRSVRFVDIMDEFRDIPGPTYYGTSIAKWNGDTLEITAKEYQASTLLDASGLPHSDELETVEHLTLVDDNTLQNRITFIDPKTFSENWDAVVTFKKLPEGTRIQDDFCLGRLNIKLYTPDL